MEFKNVLVVGTLGSDITLIELKGVPEDRAMEYAVEVCAKRGLKYKSCFRCDSVCFDDGNTEGELSRAAFIAVKLQAQTEVLRMKRHCSNLIAALSGRAVEGVLPENLKALRDTIKAEIGE